MGYKLSSNRPVYRNQIQAGNTIVPEAGKPIRIGRGREAEYQFADGRVSRVHCVLLLKGGKLTIEDRGSANGTYVNGKLVKGAVLEDGDEVRIGDTKLRVEAYDGAAARQKAVVAEIPAAAPDDAEATKIVPPTRVCESCGDGLPLTAGAATHCSKCNDPLLGRTIGDYRVVRRIATGDAAIVYHVETCSTKAPFALKVLKPEVAKNAAMAERLRRAAEIGRRLEHPNHARVHAVGDLDGRTYVVSDLAVGEAAEKLVGPGKRVDTDKGAAIGLQVAAALAFAEARGASHGDLTASQVIVASNGDARVLGFGACPCTPQAAQADRVALGRMLCWLLSGKMPTGVEPAAEAAALLSTQPKPLLEAITRLLTPSNGETTWIEALLDLLPFALRKKGRLGLPTSIREPDLLDLLSPAAGSPAEGRVSSALRARLLPRGLEAPAGYTVSVASRNGGVYPRDCVQVVRQPQGGVAILVATSVRTGLSGSILLAMLQSVCHALGLLTVKPGQLLEKCAERVRVDVQEGPQILATVAFIDPAKDQLHFSVAGTGGIVVWSRTSGQFTAPRAEGEPLGARESAARENQTVSIEAGDRILIPSHGLIGAKNAKGTAFGFERVLQALRGAGKTLPEQLEAVLAAAAAHRGASSLAGELTLLAIERSDGSEQESRELRPA